MSQDTNLSLGLEQAHVIVTGAAGQIGSVVVQHFLSAGATVTAWDINQSKMTAGHDRLFWDLVDITDEEQVDIAFQKAVRARGVIAVCVALAGLDLSFVEQHPSLCDVPLQQWKQVMDVNVNGTFLTARAWLRAIRDVRIGHDVRNVSLVRLSRYPPLSLLLTK